MARPKLQDTGDGPRTVSVRWTDDLHLKFLRLGGSRWLRKAVKDADVGKDAARPSAKKEVR